MDMDENARRYAVELIGTFLLVFFGAGSAVAGRVDGGVVVVALAFGFVLFAITYVFNPISRAHVNPAVTLGALVSKRISVEDAIAYWIAQFVGGIIAGFVLYAFVEWGGVADQTAALGSNGYGRHINVGGAIFLELIMTFFFVLVVLMVNTRAESLGFTSLAIGLAFAVVNLLGVPLDGASVNPARSLGPALFNGGTPLGQAWLFIIFPLIGGALAGLSLPFALGEGPAGWRWWRRHPPSPGRPG